MGAHTGCSNSRPLAFPGEADIFVSPNGATGAWGQTMRTDGGWIVEVYAGTNDDFAQRVYRGEVGDSLCVRLR